jgi:hypothetical protein
MSKTLSEMVKFIVEETGVSEDQARASYVAELESGGRYWELRLEWLFDERAAGRPIRNADGSLRRAPRSAFDSILGKSSG